MVERPNDVTKLSYAYNNYSPTWNVASFLVAPIRNKKQSCFLHAHTVVNSQEWGKSYPQTPPLREGSPQDLSPKRNPGIKEPACPLGAIIGLGS